jgi:hypothetical protein
MEDSDIVYGNTSNVIYFLDKNKKKMHVKKSEKVLDNMN